MEDPVYNMFSQMLEYNVEYTYRGVFTSAISDTILSLAERNLDEASIAHKLRKRVYFIMVEGLQNITRHQPISQSIENQWECPAFFMVQHKPQGYYITTGNVVADKDIKMLTEHIDTINDLEADELKKYSLDILKNGKISPKGGAGLGLIQIARKAGNRLFYRFKYLDDKFSFFYLHAKVNSGNDTFDDKENEQSLDNIVKLHQSISGRKIILNFIGVFNQDTLINLLAIIRIQMQSNLVVFKRILKLIVEMLQNVAKHADNYTLNYENGKHAIFFVSENEEYIVFNSGNFLHKNKVNSFKDYLNTINNLTAQELDELYNRILFNFDNNTDEHTGLGLVEIRRKSGEKFEYYITQADENFYFFSLKIKVKKI